MHSDMKVVHQVLIDGHAASDPSAKDAASLLGKYIAGAKNNFVGFKSRPDEINAALKVTVHHGEEGVDKEKLDSDTKQESEAQQSEVGECSAGGSKPVTDCDFLKMEEGRAQIEPGDGKETEKKEQVEADNNEVKEGVVAGTSFNHGGENQKAEAPQGEAEKRREGETRTVGKVREKQTETTSQQAESIKVDDEKTDAKRVVNKLRDIELQETKVEAKCMKGRTCERDGAEKSGFKNSDAEPGAKVTVPSPTDSSSSKDTGFGSQEGEGSIDGALVRPSP